MQAQKVENTKYIAKADNRCKAAWKIIKQNFAADDRSCGIASIKVDNNVYKNAEHIAELFNNYFINLTNLTNDSPRAYNIDYPNAISDNPKTIYLTPVHQFDIYKIILNLKNTNSTGYDDINTKMLKACAGTLSMPLCHLVNLSFTHGQFPTNLKYSLVKPLFKKGEKDNMNNYRPITLIPVISKIFEKVMYAKISNFITKHSILKDEQFGFRKNKSTSSACFMLTKLITDCLNNKTPIASIFLDMSKAFDFVDHSLLLYKLERYGIRGKALEWIQSYLSTRNQCVEVSSFSGPHKIISRSQYKTNKCGVPQGSILGPLLFILYINDLPHVTQHNCILYADDTTVVVKNKDLNTFEHDINDTLNSIINWLKRNNLQVNINKTKMIQFKTYNSKPIKLNIKHDHTTVEEVDSTIFLGIKFDRNCNWKGHIDSLCGKLNRFVYVIDRIRRVATREAALCAYHGYVSSILRYGIIIWGNSVDLDRAFKGQKKCIRALCGADFLDSCKPLFRNTSILPLPCLYVMEMCVFVHRHPTLFDRYKRVVSKRNNPFLYKLCVPRQRVKVFSDNVYCMAIRIYNKLPDSYKNLSLQKFKLILFKFLIDECFYSTNEFLLYKFRDGHVIS